MGFKIKYWCYLISNAEHIAIKVSFLLLNMALGHPLKKTLVFDSDMICYDGQKPNTIRQVWVTPNVYLMW